MPSIKLLKMRCMGSTRRSKVWKNSKIVWSTNSRVVLSRKKFNSWQTINALYIDYKVINFTANIKVLGKSLINFFINFLSFRTFIGKITGLNSHPQYLKKAFFSAEFQIWQMRTPSVCHVCQCPSFKSCAKLSILF